jgi:hypothetical protein
VALFQYGASKKVPRNEHVDIVVRRVTVNPGIESERQEYVEIREFIKSGEVYGHGILIPLNQIWVAMQAIQDVASAEEA